jgi:hypothetical protein
LACRILGGHFAVAIVVFLYGLLAFTFPLMFLVSFFVFLGMAYFRDSISAESTPGIEEMQRPHFSFSPIYLAWLFVNDRERWANYATILRAWAL